MRRVAVTGLGAITPVGNDINSLRESLFAGRHGIGPITKFDTEGFKATLAAEVKGFDASEYYTDKSEMRRTDLFAQYAMGAAVQAVDDSGISGQIENERLGVYVGSGIGGMNTFVSETLKLKERGPGRVSPFFIPMMISNIAAGTIAIRFGAKGPTLPAVTACATSTNTIGEAYRAIAYGYADAIIAGGAEATVTPLAVAGFTNCMALCEGSDPDSASIPFDARRSGFVMGEGAGILVLERAISLAAAQAGITGGDGLYINAHGTGTPMNDTAETLAVKKALGDAEARKALISSTKSMTGHMLGAAGAVEAIACVLALCEGMVPPTVGYREPDPECDLNYVPNKAVRADIKCALSSSLGFGGHNAVIAFRKV